MSYVIVKLSNQTILIDTGSKIELDDYFVSELHSDEEIIPQIYQYTEPKYDPNDLEEYGYYKILASTEPIDENVIKKLVL